MTRGGVDGRDEWRKREEGTERREIEKKKEEINGGEKSNVLKVC